MSTAADGRILVVDDHPRNVAILQKILAPRFRVASATSGEEALALAPSFLPDVVLLDIMMNGIDGYETCRRMRVLPELARVKIIMVSARAMASERLAGYEAGADDYVVKPFDPDELLAKVSVFLRLRSAEEVEIARGRILALFNHVTRTPLTAILGALDLVLDEPQLSAEQRNLLAVAREGAMRLSDYVDRLTLLSQLTDGYLDERRQEECMRALVSSAIDAVTPAAAARSISLAAVLPDTAVIECDGTQVQQAVTSILENAIRHSPDGGTVDVRLERRDPELHLTVTDDGPGIPADYLPHILEGMTVPDIRHHHGGLGLGLATAAVIVRRHGGALTAANAEGRGASFRLALPCAASAVREARPKIEARAA